MGMTLCAFNPAADLSVSLPRWGWLRHLLRSLDCDTREMVDSNEGADISAHTLRAWADAIDAALTAGQLAYVVRGPNTVADAPSHLESIAGTLGAEVSRHRRLIRMTGSHAERPDENDRAFLVRFTAWARAAGGCSQW